MVFVVVFVFLNRLKKNFYEVISFTFFFMLFAFDVMFRKYFYTLKAL